jgi:hypothetical protein
MTGQALPGMVKIEVLDWNFQIMLPLDLESWLKFLRNEHLFHDLEFDERCYVRGALRYELAEENTPTPIKIGIFFLTSIG